MTKKKHKKNISPFYRKTIKIEEKKYKTKHENEYR